MKLFCAVVEEKDAFFFVDIDPSLSVDNLKKVIKNKQEYKFHANRLKLYFAKRDSAWLDRAGAEDVTLEEFPTNFTEISRLRPRDVNTYFTGRFAPNEGEIHVLVVVPTRTDSETSTESLIAIQTNDIHHLNRIRRWKKLNEVIDHAKKATTIDNGTPTGYSDAVCNEVEKSIRMTPYEQARAEIAGERVYILHKYLCDMITSFGAVATGKETTRLYFICPILTYVCGLFNGDAQIFVQENVVGKRIHVHGFFEFVIRRGNKRICIVKTKSDNFRQGLTQNLFGCEAVVDSDGLNLVYGIVTNYIGWCFLRSTDFKIEYDESSIEIVHGVPTYDSVKKIAEQLYHILGGESTENKKQLYREE